MRFADFIVKRLDKRGTQSDLAKELNISRSTITAWRQGAKPTFEICLRLAAHYRISPTEIFQMVGDESYLQIYRQFVVPNRDEKQLSEPRATASESALKEESPLSVEHAALHDKLQRVMESGSGEASAIATMIDMVDRDLLRQEQGAPVSLGGKLKSVYRGRKRVSARTLRDKLQSEEREDRAAAGGGEGLPQEG